MRKGIYLILSAVCIVSCNRFDRGLNMRVTNNELSWTNGSVVFRTDMDSKQKNQNSPAFQISVKSEKGKLIPFPVDTCAIGYGASCPMGTSGFYKPDKGLAQAEVLIQTDERMVLHLRYNPWNIFDTPITLDKQVSMFRDSPIISVIDFYDGSFELLNIAAGMTTAFEGKVKEITDGYSIQYLNHGITGIIVMPHAEQKTINETLGTVLLKKGVSGKEPLRYYIGISDKGEDYLLEELAKIL